jgi:uncharacterized protein YecA (UPF0149 family)
MRIFAQNDPMTGVELDHLGEFLKGCTGGKAMNIEELDGFFAALVAGPEVVMPSEYLPEVFGSETPETHAFSTLAEANDILGLLMRHWNDIAATLSKDEVYLPLLRGMRMAWSRATTGLAGSSGEPCCDTMTGLSCQTMTTTADG